jgi:hypothetical protein
LQLAGVKTLIFVPRIRSSDYVRMLAQTFPEIRGAKPGEIQVDDLPDLRSLVLVDNEESAHNDLAQLRIKSMIDWRELLMWREGHGAAKARRDIAARLETDDVINLQFTRYIHDILCKLASLIEIVERLDLQKQFR